MSKNLKWLLGLLFAVALISATTTALANTIYLPYIGKDPTPTATLTPTATNTPTPTRTATPTPTATPEPGVYIEEVVNGDSNDDLDEEYVLITNESGESVKMTDWTLRDENKNVYTFKAFTLKDDASVKVWTKSGTDTSSNLYWRLDEPIWAKGGECAKLLDDDDDFIYQLCYPVDSTK